MEKCYVVDTSAWVEFFEGNGEFQLLMTDVRLKTPLLVLGELIRVLSREGWFEAEIAAAIEKVKANSTITHLDENQVINAGNLSMKKKFSFIDALHYVFASESELFLTTDSGFKEVKNVKYVKVN